MVTPGDIATVLGRPAPDGTQAEQWQRWIDDALLLIAARARQWNVDVASLDADVVDYVVREAVVAQTRRPDDATQVSISVDDGTVSRSYSSATGRVAILADWWDLLGLGSAGGAFSIRPYGAPDPCVWPEGRHL